MTTIAEQLLAFSGLCNDAADRLVDRIDDLGPRPADVVGANAWDLALQRLQCQIELLTGAASEDAALAVSQALTAYETELDELKRVTDVAETRIAEIAKTSAMITTVGKILDVALAIAATAADPADLPTLVGKIAALADDVGANRG